jgi:hypothetical protein
MAPIPPPAFPPVTAEYASTLQAAGTKGPPIQSAYRFARAADGKTRVDSGNTSVISNPITAQTILLDHAKKTATIQPGPFPAPPAAAPPPMPHLAPPAMPKLPALPNAPTVKVEDLGKTLLDGHEVEGKRFVMPPPTVPAAPGFQMPAMPKVPGFKIPGMPKPPAMQVPGMPKPPEMQVPGMPKAPAMQAPAAPKPPQMPGMPPPPAAPPLPGMPPPPAAPHAPTTAEVWNSTKMGLPMLTKMTGGFGQLTQVCKKAVPGEPPPAAFQIPQGYKVTTPKL